MDDDQQFLGNIATEADMRGKWNLRRRRQKVNDRREIHDERTESVKAFQDHWKPASEDYTCRFNMMLTVGDIAWLKSLKVSV